MSRRRREEQYAQNEGQSKEEPAIELVNATKRSEQVVAVDNVRTLDH